MPFGVVTDARAMRNVSGTPCANEGCAEAGCVDETSRNPANACPSRFRLMGAPSCTSRVWRKVRLRTKSMYCSMRTMSVAIRRNVSATCGGKFETSMPLKSASAKYWSRLRAAALAN
jgi:hypothetical protein